MDCSYWEFNPHRVVGQRRGETRGIKKTRRRRKGCWQRLTLPPSHPGSTISAGELNCRVRDGTGWTLTALATNTHTLLASRLFPCSTTTDLSYTFSRSRFHLHDGASTPLLTLTSAHFPASQGQSPRPLVRVSSTHYCASTSRLSSSSSSSGLSGSRQGESRLEVSFPLRCFQRFSAPEIATRPCRWRDNRRTSAPSTPVLSY